MNIAISYILISVLLGAVGQVLLKKGMSGFGPLTLSFDKVLITIWRMAINPYVFIGLSIYLLSTVFWLTALSRVDLSYAYPFASLSYVLMLVASWILFAESITPMRLFGTMVIGIGVWFISRS